MDKNLSPVFALVTLMCFYYYLYHTKDTPSTGNRDYFQGQLFSNSCECRSLFTINFCAENMAEKLTFTEQNLRRLHRGKHLKGHVIYSNLSKFLPLSYKMQIKVNKTKAFVENIVRKNQTFWHKFYQDLDPSVPYVPCTEHVYLPSEVKKCIDKFNAVAGRELKIAFVGDSTVRGYMETLVQDYDKEFRFHFRNSNLSLDIYENFLNNKIKFDLLVGGTGLQLKFYWAPFLEENTNFEKPQWQGARDVIKHWVYGTNDEDLPDIVYLSVGLWNAVQMDPIEAIINHFHSLNNMSQLITELALKTKVLFQVTPPIKEWLLFGNKSNPQDVLDFINQIKFIRLYNSNVWMWDSLYPVAIRDNYECQIYFSLKKLFKINTPDEWACSDYMHFGSKTEKSGNNQVWNYVCNKLMKKGKDACCS